MRRSPRAERALERVALVVSADRRNHGALLRAASFASLRGADLRVIVCASRPTVRVPSSARVTSPLRETLEWIAALAPDSPVETRVGPPLAIGLEVARTGCADLLVLGDADVERADRVVAIAAETGTPVLVARRSGGRSSVLAATDLEDATMPVLSAASWLASSLDAQLFAVHNLAPPVVSPLSPFGHPRALACAIDASASRARLMDAVRRSSPDGYGLVCSTVDTARLVMDLAEAIQADAVVVGGRTRSRVRTLLAPSVPERIVSHARTSVLVTPMAAAADSFIA